jgi:hypothetical protein
MLAEPLLLRHSRKKLIARLKRQHRAERSEDRRNPSLTPRRSNA